MHQVLVVDDSPVDRRLAGGLLEVHPQMQVRYAANGREALAVLSAGALDLVVTDLQMPEMNGLELVGAIRSRFPLVPVVLMTGQGSEEIAVKALEQGAASYVAKANLAHDLLETVEHVLAVARADRRHASLLGCMRHSRLEMELPNDPTLIPPLVELLQEQIRALGICDETEQIRLGVALEESLLNALYHGNLELGTDELREASTGLFETGAESVVAARQRQAPYCERRIAVQAEFTPQEARITIRDQGPGFDVSGAPDPSDPANLERATGRGLVLMRTFLDEVRFNARGNEVTLIKRRAGE